jgi:hypothetical protein
VYVDLHSFAIDARLREEYYLLRLRSQAGLICSIQQGRPAGPEPTRALYGDLYR